MATDKSGAKKNTKRKVSKTSAKELEKEQKNREEFKLKSLIESCKNLQDIPIEYSYEFITGVKTWRLNGTLIRDMALFILRAQNISEGTNENTRLKNFYFPGKEKFKNLVSSSNHSANSFKVVKRAPLRNNSQYTMSIDSSENDDF